MNRKLFENHSFQRGPVNSTFYQSLIVEFIEKLHVADGIRFSNLSSVCKCCLLPSVAVLVLLFLNQVAFQSINITK